MNIIEIRKLFPIFENYPDLIYLDSASTTQKPQIVMNAESEFYQSYNANIHRGIYKLAEKADQIYANSRKIIANFCNAQENEIIFTKNATEGANLSAEIIAQNFVKGDIIVSTELEHHSNFLPWQEIARKNSLQFRVIKVKNNNGDFDDKDLELLKDKKVKLLAITGLSNVLGIKPDLKNIIKMAKENGVLIALDLAQASTNYQIDVKKLNCDFAFFTGHKLFGPMGTGWVYIKQNLAEKLNPYQFGGGMIKDLPNKWLDAPSKFEAGTPNVAGIYALSKSLKMMQEIGLENIIKYEKKLVKVCYEMFSKFSEIEIYGPTNENQFSNLLSFEIKNIHSHDVASIFAEDNICIRAGHHCAKPLMNRLKVNALARVSFSIYNQESDIEKLEKSIKKAINIFK